MEAREFVRCIEEGLTLPSGNSERFAGYAVIGLPFQSGHVLALRRFPVSSLGTGYTSVWHREPGGKWTFYSTVAPEQSCSRYFGGEVEENLHAEVRIEWSGPDEFRVLVEASRPLIWEIKLTTTLASRLLNSVADLLPDSWWQNRVMLRIMGLAGRFLLGAGKMNLAGATPNGHEFIANPQRVWLVKSSRALVNGADIGPVGPLSAQAQLNEFLIPQRGIFAIARAFMKKRDKIVPLYRIRQDAQRSHSV
jgi:hypothetical protein